MENIFGLLTRFLERYDGDVEGREVQEPAEDVRLKLQALARGELKANDQRELLTLLTQNPQWIPRLADEVKALRNRPG